MNGSVVEYRHFQQRLERQPNVSLGVVPVNRMSHPGAVVREHHRLTLQRNGMMLIP